MSFTILQDRRRLALLLDLHRRNMHGAGGRLRSNPGPSAALRLVSQPISRGKLWVRIMTRPRVAQPELEQRSSAASARNRLDPAVGTGSQQAADLLIEGARNERGTDVEIAREPPGRQESTSGTET
jgi:hypothetical protein